MLSSNNHWLRVAERNGERCAGPVILAGLLIGLGMVQLASGPMAQTSRFSLELLILLALAWLLPRWMARIELEGQVSWSHSMPAAVVVGALLLLMFFCCRVRWRVGDSARGSGWRIP